MTYKFVTREEVIALWRPDVPGEAIKILNRLFAERDAYRKVAILLYAKQITVQRDGRIVEAEFIDAEAARLMEKK